MNTSAFSTIVLKESMPKIQNVVDYMQQTTQGAKFNIGKIEDDKDDILFYVLATNLIEGEEGAFVRRFLNAIERPGHKSVMPIMTFTEHPEIKTPEQLKKRLDRYRDGSCKVNFYQRNCKP